MMFEITGFHSLMEEEPVGRKSVKIRKIVLPLFKYSAICTHEITEKTKEIENARKIGLLVLFWKY